MRSKPNCKRMGILIGGLCGLDVKEDNSGVSFQMKTKIDLGKPLDPGTPIKMKTPIKLDLFQVRVVANVLCGVRNVKA